MAQMRAFFHAGRKGVGVLEDRTIRAILEGGREWRIVLTSDDIESGWQEAERMFRRMAEEYNRDLELI